MGRLTRDQITQIVGTIDEVKAAEIIATGANLEELEEAVAWASRITQVGEDLERPLAGVVARVYRILTIDQEYEDENERS